MVLIIDEMKIREDLVYDKTGTCLHGFVNLGDVNNQLPQLEMQSDVKKTYDCLAKQMLTIMVRGIFIKLEFPYASFPSQGNVYLRVFTLRMVQNYLFDLDMQVLLETCYTGSCGKLFVV